MARPYQAPMDLEKTRLFVQQLFAPPTSDAASTVALLCCLRNAVIGNNKQKTNVIALGAVPRLLQVSEKHLIFTKHIALVTTY